jgi:hypothetical protein
MYLVKQLQGVIAPAGAPWTPRGNPALRRFVNQLVLEEESDQGPFGPPGEPVYASHFEPCCQAMTEVGADGEAPLRFARVAEAKGLEAGPARGPRPTGSLRPPGPYLGLGCTEARRHTGT